MLWDPTFRTWQSLGVRFNSQMMLVSADLESATDLVFGFTPEQQDAILGALDNF